MTDKIKAQLKVATPSKELRLVFPEDLGKGLKANQATRQFEVDLTEYVGDGLELKDGKLKVQNSLNEKSDKIEDRLDALEKRNDKFLTSVVPTRHGNQVQFVYTFSDGTFSAVDFEDKDTVAIAFDPTPLETRLALLEAKLAQVNTLQSLAIQDGKVKITMTNGQVFEALLPQDTATSAFGDVVNV